MFVDIYITIVYYSYGILMFLSTLAKKVSFLKPRNSKRKQTRWENYQETKSNEDLSGEFGDGSFHLSMFFDWSVSA